MIVKFIAKSRPNALVFENVTGIVAKRQADHGKPTPIEQQNKNNGLVCPDDETRDCEVGVEDCDGAWQGWETCLKVGNGNQHQRMRKYEIYAHASGTG